MEGSIGSERASDERDGPEGGKERASELWVSRKRWTYLLLRGGLGKLGYLVSA